jgi:predicted ester cyclase
MRDIAQLLHPQGERRQSLAGFDADYVDIVDYIVRCTHRIWEQKRLDLIYSHYTYDCAVHTLSGETVGAQAVVDSTARTLAAFPDRVLIADDVIWGGDDRNGFLSSHRIVSHMTNLGASDFGPATGRRATIMTIADCAVLANRIYEEWLVRDNLSMVLQLGLDPIAVARTLAAQRPATPDAYARWRTAEIERVLGAAVLGQATPLPNDAAAFFAQALSDIWNGKRFDRVREVYAPSAELHAPAGRELFGHGEITGHFLFWLGAIPSARVTIDHVCSVARDGGLDVAIRWSLAGKHQGPGLLLAPKGATVLLLGVSHLRVEQSQIVEEWTVFDELALLRQIVEAA